jgi:hypothetical protein
LAHLSFTVPFPPAGLASRPPLTVLVLLLANGLSSVQTQNFGRNKVVYDDFNFAWESNERIPVFSTGLSARVDVLGFGVVELMDVFPFQYPDKAWHFDFQISPRW